MNDRWNERLSSIRVLRDIGLTPHWWEVQRDPIYEEIENVEINGRLVFQEILPNSLTRVGEDFEIYIAWKYDGHYWSNCLVVYVIGNLVLWIFEFRCASQIDTIFTFNRHDYECEVRSTLPSGCSRPLSEEHLRRFFECARFPRPDSALYLTESHSTSQSPHSALRNLNEWWDRMSRDDSPLQEANADCIDQKSRVSIGLDIPGFPECQFEVGLDQSGEKVLRLLAYPWFPIALKIDDDFPWSAGYSS
ncbi:hypothetical protein [Planctomicrobium sp. SH527]|uniref:hypothetical protein n=1 Tax=Planctomicrobium sp. SH527 TaxID=3448123 RepID=UPI003F5C71CE